MAQVPEKVSYQTIIRNTSGELVKSGTVGLRISILRDSASGTAAYIETHTVSTNINGLATLDVGMGTVETGAFSSIDWGNSPYFLKIETDPTGGTSYSITGISEILSVPYALFAKKAETVENETQGLSDVTAINNRVNKQLKNVIDPTDAQDAATKAYVDKLFGVIGALQNGTTDLDGNKYKTVLIGEQTWMAENLKTTKYNNGTALTNITDATQWWQKSVSTTTGAYCSYNNDDTKVAGYGRIYNWNAVNTGMLCPSGWHVPTDDDWAELRSYLILNGYNFDNTTTGNKVGKSLASTSNWAYWNITGTVGNTSTTNNKSGFNALPAGYRNDNGEFESFGNTTIFWCITDEPSLINSKYSEYYMLSYKNSTLIYNLQASGYCGFSVRCIKDN